MPDIIIRGMEMRSACSGETDCFALDEYGDYPMCRITGETRGYTFPIQEKCMDGCPLRPAPGKQPETNGDKYRNMTDEELAYLLCDHACALCPITPCEGRMEIGRGVCYKRWLNYLQSPADGGDHDA